MKELLELDRQVRDSLDWLQSALQTAGNLCTEDTGGATPWGEPISRDAGWKEMEEVYRRLAAARNVLATALEPVAELIAEERKRHDDGPDEIDPQGFKYHPIT